MRGHIKKRYPGSYTIVLDLGKDPSTGKRKQQWTSVKGTKKEADKRLGELIHQLDTGTFLKPGKTTLTVFLEKWMESSKPNLAPRTAEGYEHIIRKHIIPSLGGMILTQIKPEHIQQYYTKKLSGLSPRTVNHHHATLHAALKSAMNWGLLIRNPADAVEPPRYQRQEMHILDEFQIETLLQAAKSTEYYEIFFVALYTGLRRSELLALRWQDVDLLLCQISINRSLHHLRDGRTVFRPPKTAKGRRTVAISPNTAIMLREYLVKKKAHQLDLVSPLKDEDLIFCHSDGRAMLPDSITHAWIKMTRKLGLNVRLHDARHTHASLLLKQGVHPKIVQERLGHASIQLTLDTYSHVTPGLQAAAAESFDRIIPRHQEVLNSTAKAARAA
jgi:integrase